MIEEAYDRGLAFLAERAGLAQRRVEPDIEQDGYITMHPPLDHGPPARRDGRGAPGPDQATAGDRPMKIGQRIRKARRSDR